MAKLIPGKLRMEGVTLYEERHSDEIIQGGKRK